LVRRPRTTTADYGMGVSATRYHGTGNGPFADWAEVDLAFYWILPHLTSAKTSIPRRSRLGAGARKSSTVLEKLTQIGIALPVFHKNFDPEDEYRSPQVSGLEEASTDQPHAARLLSSLAQAAGLSTEALRWLVSTHPTLTSTASLLDIKETDTKCLKPVEKMTQIGLARLIPSHDATCLMSTPAACILSNISGRTTFNREMEPSASVLRPRNIWHGFVSCGCCLRTES